MRKLILVSLISVAAAAAQATPLAMLASLAVGQNPNRLYQLNELKVETIRTGSKSFKVWVMDTDSKRQEGMMHLRARDVPRDHGMIFVFKSAEPLAFWMRNTYIPLDIAYLDAKGKAVSVHRMEPLDERSVPSAAPAMYALEMVQGSFARHGIRKGTVFSIPKSIKAKD